MTILAFDTSGPVLSITLALHAQEEPRSLHWVRDTGLRHAEHLVPDIRTLLGEAGCTPADIDLVATAEGPGSFTGLRIGLATAKGFAAARETPFVGVPTLEMWAELYRFWPGLTVPAIDARKQRFYAAFFRAGRRLTDDLDEAAQAVLERGKGLAEDAEATSAPILLCGPHGQRFADACGRPVEGLRIAAPTGVVASEALVRLGLERFRRYGGSPPEAGLRYVRRSDAEMNL